MFNFLITYQFLTSPHYHNPAQLCEGTPDTYFWFCTGKEKSIFLLQWITEYLLYLENIYLKYFSSHPNFIKSLFTYSFFYSSEEPLRIRENIDITSHFADFTGTFVAILNYVNFALKILIISQTLIIYTTHSNIFIDSTAF